MDSVKQANGEKRVRQVLIEPLQRRGLVRPARLTKIQFEDMVKDLCARLAYMSEPNLQALEDQCAGNPSGKAKDRFPIANMILSWAAQIQPPGDEASPLIRAAFSAEVGLAALAGGWAPELLGELKSHVAGQPFYVLSKIKERADNNIRQMQRIEERISRNESIPAPDLEWRARRLSSMRKCQSIADVATSQGMGT